MDHSPLLCIFSDFPEHCLGGDKSGESWRLLLGGETSGESWGLVLGGETSGESWRLVLWGETSGEYFRLLFGGEMSGESCRRLLGGETSGESCRVFLTGESRPLLFEDNSGESCRPLLNEPASVFWCSFPFPSSVSSFWSTFRRGSKTIVNNSLNLILHKSPPPTSVTSYLPPITFHLLLVLKTSICFTSSGRSSITSAIWTVNKRLSFKTELVDITKLPKLQAYPFNAID